LLSRLCRWWLNLTLSSLLLSRRARPLRRLFFFLLFLIYLRRLGDTHAIKWCGVRWSKYQSRQNRADPQPLFCFLHPFRFYDVKRELPDSKSWPTKVSQLGHRDLYYRLEVSTSDNLQSQNLEQRFTS